MSTTADLHKAIVAAWDDADLDTTFNTFWALSDRTIFLVLSDAEAQPSQPYPYCVYESEAGLTAEKMSGNTSSSRYEIRHIPWEFRVHARQLSGVAKSAKENALELANEIIKIFGGHPTVVPATLTLDNGDVIHSTYETDYGVREGDEEYMWIIRYTFILDVPVAA